MTNTLSYEEAVISAAAEQGLGAPLVLLGYAGHAPFLWQSGGFTMVLVMIIKGQREVWVTWEGDDDYLVGVYHDDGEEMVNEAHEGCGFAELLATVERLSK